MSRALGSHAPSRRGPEAASAAAPRHQSWRSKFGPRPRPRRAPNAVEDGGAAKILAVGAPLLSLLRAQAADPAAARAVDSAAARQRYSLGGVRPVATPQNQIDYVLLGSSSPGDARSDGGQEQALGSPAVRVQVR